MIYNQINYPVFSQGYLAQQQVLRAQQQWQYAQIKAQQKWQPRQELQLRQEWQEQQMHIAKASHALSDFMNEVRQIQAPYQLQATFDFMAVIIGNQAGGMR